MGDSRRLQSQIQSPEIPSGSDRKRQNYRLLTAPWDYLHNHIYRHESQVQNDRYSPLGMGRGSWSSEVRRNDKRGSNRKDSRWRLKK